MVTQWVRTSAQLRMYLFGHFRMEREKEPVRFPTRKVQLLLAYLALHPQSHSREKLATLFWPDVPDASAHASLRNALSSLRRQIDPGLLEVDRGTAQMNASYPIWVDALAFQAQATRFLNAPSPDPNAVNLGLYTDDLLADFYEDWILVEREALRTLYLETLLELIQQLRSHSDYERALEFAERVLATDRANERAHQHRMFCYAAVGNRDAALRQYEVCLSALSDELAVEPSSATKKLRAWIAQERAERTPVGASTTNLPIPLTSFVGRQREIAGVKARLSSVRLLTLSGAGGSGKTRLAIRVATNLLDIYPDGVWWVELAALADANLLTLAVAKALGVSEVPTQPISETLVSFLRLKKLLLVLDNCEHLITACAQLVERLLRECLQLKLLTTSREILGISGEHIWAVPTLSAPDPRLSTGVDELLHHAAIRLFVGRAMAVRPDFTLSDENARSVAEICWRLEGLPLAIELAAARVNMLTVEQIAARLDNAFQLLAGSRRTALPRHQTLRAAIDWSYELLTEQERILFRRLSVFAGGWTLPGAEAICAGEGIQENQILDLLSRLVDKSLVEVQPRGREMRFRMLETIRQYSAERLLESSEYDTVHDRHLYYFLRLVEAANPHLGYFLSDRDAGMWLGQFEEEYDNLRAAIRWSVEQEQGPQTPVEAGLRLAVSLHWFWFARGHWREGRGWLEGALAQAAILDAPAARAKALWTAGGLAWLQGDYTAARSLLEESIAISRALGAPGKQNLAHSLTWLGLVVRDQGDPAGARSPLEESVALLREIGNRWRLAAALVSLGRTVIVSGDPAAARPILEEGRTIYQEIGDKWGLAVSLNNLGLAALREGDYRRAARLYQEGVALFGQEGEKFYATRCLEELAWVRSMQNEYGQAMRLFGAAEAQRETLGVSMPPNERAEHDRNLDDARAQLGEEQFSAAWVVGQAMSMEQAIAYALEADGP